MAGAQYGHGMASVNRARARCVNQRGKTHSKPLAARHGHGMLCVNRPLEVSIEACVLHLVSMNLVNMLGVFRIVDDNSHPNTVSC
jgi:hypothetical protein